MKKGGREWRMVYSEYFLFFEKYSELFGLLGMMIY
jgi:hypothetical protein